MFKRPVMSNPEDEEKSLRGRADGRRSRRRIAEDHSLIGQQLQLFKRNITGLTAISIAVRPVTFRTARSAWKRRMCCERITGIER